MKSEKLKLAIQVKSYIKDLKASQQPIELKNSQFKDASLRDRIIGEKFIWAWGNTVYTSTLTFDASGKIINYNHPNEATWDINKDGNLIVFNRSNELQWVFKEKDKRNGKLYFETKAGRYLKQNSLSSLNYFISSLKGNWNLSPRDFHSKWLGEFNASWTDKFRLSARTTEHLKFLDVTSKESLFFLKGINYLKLR